MIDYVVLLVLALIIGGAVWYVVRSKRKGQKCIGCSQSCNGNCSCCGNKE